MRKIVLLTASIFFIVVNASALTKTELDTSITSTIAKCHTDVKGCREITTASSGVLVFPEVTKGGIGLAYESGQGALLEHGKVTGYYKTSSASLGATLGVGTKSVILAFKTPEELTKFKNSSGWDVGGQAGVAMLSSGTDGAVDTSNIKESIVGIVFGQSGLLADVSLKGSKISSIDTKDIG